MSYCTFWDHTILHRFREYDDPVSADEDIFNYVTSSNNRDGLAIKAAGYSLLQREEEKKILIILSDGRPYDVIINRPNAKNPAPYQGKYAISDTASEVRRLRSQASVFWGYLQAKRRIFRRKRRFLERILPISVISEISRRS